jgi:hypothetical protein
MIADYPSNFLTKFFSFCLPGPRFLPLQNSILSVQKKVFLKKLFHLENNVICRVIFDFGEVFDRQAEILLVTW